MIAVIGGGNVATHLFNALKDKTDVCMVNPRTLEGLPENPEVIIISVSDKAISEVARRLPHSDAIVVHTAGSVPMQIFEGITDRFGVLYPLQTFTKNLDLNYKEIPVFVEGCNREVTEKVSDVAALFSENVNLADSKQRERLHLASVFACNFTNALAGMAQDILTDSPFSLKDLLPLMQQTIDKLNILSPTLAQTGPAVRHDLPVMEKQLESLRDFPELQQIYSLISSYIMEKS